LTLNLPIYMIHIIYNSVAMWRGKCVYLYSSRFMAICGEFVSRTVRYLKLHTHKRTNIRTQTHTHEHTHTHKHTRTHTHTHTNSHTHTHTHAQTNTHARTHTHTQTHTNSHTHTQTHTHTHTHKQTHTHEHTTLCLLFEYSFWLSWCFLVWIIIISFNVYPKFVLH
jgi:cation transport ATPase